VSLQFRRLPFPQPHAWPLWASAILDNKLDACGFEGRADVPKKVIARRSPFPLEVPDRRYSNLACLGKRNLGPVEKPTCSSTLGGDKRSFDRAKREEFKLDVRKRNRHDYNRQHI
jgi:hypothetical protein